MTENETNGEQSTERVATDTLAPATNIIEEAVQNDGTALEVQIVKGENVVNPFSLIPDSSKCVTAYALMKSLAPPW